MIRFKCENCGQKFKVPEKNAGKKSKCPKCKHPIVVPLAEQESAQESSIIKFRCPNCNQKIGVKKEHAGKRVRCAKCKSPLRVPQASGQSGRSGAEDKTAVLRAGQEQRSTDEGFWGDLGSRDELLLEEPKASSVEREDYYGVGESDFPAYTGQLSQSGAFAEGDVRGEPPKKKKSGIFIGAACVAVLLLVGIVVWYFLAGSDAGEKQKQIQLNEVQEFAEQYLGILENSEIDDARKFLSPGLAKSVQKGEIEKFTKQLNKSEIVELECRVKNFEEHPEGNQFYLRYTVHYENENQHIAISVLEVDEELRIDGIAIEEPFGGTFSIGARSFEELEGRAFAAEFGKIKAIATKFFCGFIVVILVVVLVQIISMWVIFDKVGQPGWAAIVPYYNMWVLAEVGDKPGWLGLLMCFCGFIPYVGYIVGLVLSIVISIGVAKAFGRGVGFGIGLSLLPFVFYPILAFAGD